jgi:predicted acetyltransferase
VGGVDLVLRPLRPGDESAFVDAYAALAREGFQFGHEYTPGTPWADYLARMDELRAGVNVDGFVPTTFLVAEVRGRIVGRTSVRHRLNAALTQVGGHIGYCVLPDHRRRGYATEILRQSLPVARSHGVHDVLVTCDDTNLASRRVIEACGGRLASTDGITRRYWLRSSP